jgi:hypothetical protein
MTSKKAEPPLFIDLPFEEAMRRFIQTDPAEVKPAPGQTRKSTRPKPGAPKAVKPSAD